MRSNSINSRMAAQRSHSLPRRWTSGRGMRRRSGRGGKSGSATQPGVRLLSLHILPEPPGADPHAVVVWGGRSAMTALTRLGAALLRLINLLVKSYSEPAVNLHRLMPVLLLPPIPDTAPAEPSTLRPSGWPPQTLLAPNYTSLWSQNLPPSAVGLSHHPG